MFTSWHGILQLIAIRFTSLYRFELLVSCGMIKIASAMIIFLELKPLGISSNRDDHGISFIPQNFPQRLDGFDPDPGVGGVS